MSIWFGDWHNVAKHRRELFLDEKSRDKNISSRTRRICSCFWRMKMSRKRFHFPFSPPQASPVTHCKEANSLIIPSQLRNEISSSSFRVCLWCLRSSSCQAISQLHSQPSSLNPSTSQLFNEWTYIFYVTHKRPRRECKQVFSLRPTLKENSSKQTHSKWEINET